MLQDWDIVLVNLPKDSLFSGPTELLPGTLVEGFSAAHPFVKQVDGETGLRSEAIVNQ